MRERQTEMPRVGCVTFDLDDTLWDIDPVIERAEGAFYAWLRAHYPQITRRFEPTVLSEHRQTYYTRHPHMRHDFTWLRRRWLAHLGDEHSCGADFEHQAFDYYWRLRNKVELFSDAEPTLAAVAARYRTGVITNGNACVDQIGISHHFEFVVSAESAGAAKPERAIFDAAVCAAGVEPREIVHVGDDPVRDVIGAQRSGFSTIWYNPARAPWPGGPAPSRTIHALGELLGALDSLISD